MKTVTQVIILFAGLVFCMKNLKPTSHARYYKNPLPLLLLSILHITATAAPSEQDIHDAILGKKAFSDTELQAMDRNKDGSVDVADLAYRPLVEFAASSSQGREGEDTLSIQINANIPLQSTVHYSLRRLSPTLGEEKSGQISFDGNTAEIDISLSDTGISDDQNISESAVWQVTLNDPADKSYAPGSAQIHTLFIHDNDTLWHGSLTTADNVNIPLVLQLDQANGAVTGKLIADPNNGMISSEQADQAQVSIQANSQSFRADITSIQIPSTTSWTGVSFQRQITLNAAADSGQSIDLNILDMLTGSFSEQITAAGAPFLNRTQQGNFVLIKQMSDIAAPVPALESAL
ncbi:MAG: hypothetical protein GY862_14140 [Gammaproteobacteria bacterium]|nr:hypothetical protein [Gammaproteobacteria bacterium]